MLTCTIYRFLQEGFKTFKNGCNFCFHKEVIKRARWQGRDTYGGWSQQRRLAADRCTWGRAGAYGHSLLRPYDKESQRHRKRRLGEKVPAGERRRHSFGRWKRTGKRLPGWLEPCCPGRMEGFEKVGQMSRGPGGPGNGRPGHLYTSRTVRLNDRPRRG